MTEEKKQDARAHPRVGARLVIRAKYEKVDEFIDQITDNVSRGGIFIESRETYPEGTLLRFEIRLKDGQSVMRGEGNVVWARSSGDAANKPPGMGVKFTAMDRKSKALLAEILKNKEARKKGVAKREKTAPQGGQLIEELDRAMEEIARLEKANAELAEELREMRRIHGLNTIADEEMKETLDEMEQRLGEVRKENKEQKKELERLRKELVRLGTTNEMLNRQVEQMNAELARVQDESELARKENDNDGVVVVELRAEIEQMKKEYFLTSEAHRMVSQELEQLKQEESKSKGLQREEGAAEGEASRTHHQRGEAFIAYNFMGEIIDVDENACELTGYDKQELIGSLIDEIEDSGDDGERIMTLIETRALIYRSAIRKRGGETVSVTTRGKVVSLDGQGLIHAYTRAADELLNNLEDASYPT